MRVNPGQTITDQEFELFRQLIHRLAGIALSDQKRALLVGRLGRRLRQLGLDTYTQYYSCLTADAHPGELQTLVDLLTTNETYFFREPQHFDFLRQAAGAERAPTRPYRVWSAAASSGEEAYSMAMTLADGLGDAPWEVFGTDISQAVLARAREGIYPLERTAGIPNAMLKKYCLKGVRAQAGQLLIDRPLRERVRFAQLNLTRPIRGVGEFDVIFLRNVMIYFDQETKRRVVGHLLPFLKPHGYFVVGHAESLHGVADGVVPVRPTIYRRPA